MKKIALKLGVLLSLWLTFPSFAYSTIPKGFASTEPVLFIQYLLLAIGIFVILLSFIFMYRITIKLIDRVRELERQNNPDYKYISLEKEAKVSWWQKLYNRLSDATPIENEKDIMFDHEYDGIRELDNNLPSWWLYGFYFTIIFSFFYMGLYHFSGNAQSSHEEYYAEMDEANLKIEEYLSKQANLVNENNVALLKDATSLADGKRIFSKNCITCHLDSGGGSPESVGPNLTDEYWLHGGGIKNVFKTVKYGVPEKGMIAWQTQLSPADIHKVASYLLSLQGSNPPNAKEPQGALYKEKEEPAATE